MNVFPSIAGAVAPAWQRLGPPLEEATIEAVAEDNNSNIIPEVVVSQQQARTMGSAQHSQLPIMGSKSSLQMHGQQLFHTPGQLHYQSGNPNFNNFGSSNRHFQPKNAGQQRLGTPDPCQICGRRNHIAMKCFYRWDYSYQASKDFSLALTALSTSENSDPNLYVDT